jgi:hypothetical protein
VGEDVDPSWRRRVKVERTPTFDKAEIEPTKSGRATREENVEGAAVGEARIYDECVKRWESEQVLCSLDSVEINL